MTIFLIYVFLLLIGFICIYSAFLTFLLIEWGIHEGSSMVSVNEFLLILSRLSL